MVRGLIRAAIVAAHVSAAPGVSAQTVDWTRAGGDLFGRTAASPAAEEALDGFADARLAPLSQPFMDAIATAARRHGLDPKLLHALVLVESGYDPGVCSPVGACGLTQLMPATAGDLRVRDRFDPVENLRGGADYLARQIMEFGDVRLALAAYNSGPGRVRRLGRIPEIPETRDYVGRVVECYLALTAGRGVRSARDCAPREVGL